MSEEIDRSLQRLEELASNENDLSNIKENIGEIRKWVDSQKSKEDEESKNNWAKDFKGFCGIVKTSIESFEDITSGDHFKVMKGSLSIVTSIASVVSGPYGIAAQAVCGILSAVLAFNSPANEQSPLQEFAEVVQLEFQKHTRQNLSQNFAAISKRIRNLLVDLRTLKSKEAAKCDDLKDSDLIYKDFPAFIAEIGSLVMKSFAPDSKSEDLKGWVWFVTLYCKACTAEFILFGILIARFKSTGQDIERITGYFEDQKKESMIMLGFLSDKENMRKNALLPFQGGKILKMMHVRQNQDAYRVTEQFRGALGLSVMPEYDDIQLALSRAKKCCVILKFDSYGSTDSNRCSFQFINHSKFPVKIISGIVGDHSNGLLFKKDISSYSSYERPTQGTAFSDRLSPSFSTGGYFVIYMDGILMSHPKSLNGKDMRVTQFSLSDPIIGFKKISMLDKTLACSEADKRDCYKRMDSDSSPPIYFSHNGKHYIIACEIYPQIYNGTYTWRFLIQVYDPIKDVGIKV